MNFHSQLILLSTAAVQVNNIGIKKNVWIYDLRMEGINTQKATILIILIDFKLLG